VKYKNLCYCRETTRHAVLVNSCYVQESSQINQLTVSEVAVRMLVSCVDFWVTNEMWLQVNFLVMKIHCLIFQTLI